MAFIENISFKSHIDSANQKFNESENRLSKLEDSFQARMNGKTISGVVGAMFGTVCWLVAFCIFFWYIREWVDSILYMVCFGISMALFIAMLVDEYVEFSYYGKIFSYKKDIAQLKDQIDVGRSAVKTNRDVFVESCTNGWNHPLSAGSSILEEADLIESTLNSMEGLKGGMINRIKNLLFFTNIIGITIVGSYALFVPANEIIVQLTGGALESDTLQILLIAGILVAGIGEIVLAKMAWSKTECVVTNATIFVSVLGPILFISLVSVVAVVIALVIWIVSIALVILAVVVGGATLFGLISGG